MNTTLSSSINPIMVNFSVAGTISTYHLILVPVVIVLLQQLVHAQDVNVSRGLRGTRTPYKTEAPLLVEENLQTDLNGLETRHKSALRKLIKKKIRVHEQSAELEVIRIWWLNHKPDKRFSIILDHFPNVGL
jgi:IMP dehydrogenase/GMP reductase